MNEIRERVLAELTKPDGMFPVAVEDVRGRPLPVLTKRRRSQLDFMGESGGHAENEFLVHGDRRITHAHFESLVAAEAHHLAADHGVVKGDRVAILSANSPDWVLAYFAVLSLGAIAAAYNGWWTPDEIQYATELTLHQYDITRLHCHIYAGAHGYPHIITGQGRGIVYAVTNHAHLHSLALQFCHLVRLEIRQNLGNNFLDVCLGRNCLRCSRNRSD